MPDNKLLLRAVRAVGILKPNFNPQTRQFEPPRLEVFGTGFWLKSGAFITCAHVVEQILNKPIDIAGMLVVGGNGKPYRKTVISVVDYLHDLAVLNVEPNDAADNQLLEQEFVDGLEVHSEALDVGDEIAYAGFPLGTQLLNQNHSPTYAEGVVGNEVVDEVPGSKTIQISGPVVGGYSGAPIVLKRDCGKVVSVVSHSPSQEAGQASIFRGVHWKHIESLNQLKQS